VRNRQSLTETDDIKFLGVQLDNHLTCKSHTDLLLYKLSIVCFIIRRQCHVLNNDALQITYFGYFHPLIKYGIISGETKYHWQGFLIHKRMMIIMMMIIIIIIIIIMGIRTRCSGKGLCKNLDILPVPCVCVCVCVCIYIYRCPRRKGQYSGRS
jgi:hypothetical protein